jgi:DNA-binding NtrC family response regulator
MFESEFFGHEKGAYTSAHSRKIGKLEMAHTGTILLDEIGDLPLESQAKILRAIEDKSFQRLGGVETMNVDVRIIVASNKNLQQLANENSFREDLFYRLSVITIKIPPLRDRREDIPPLVDLFLNRFAFEMNKNKPDLSPAAITKLQNYPWQGNIRELKNFIERLLVFHSGKNILEENDLRPDSNEETFQFPSQLLELPYDKAKRKILNDFKQFYPKQALQKYGGSITATAREVGINRASLHKMLQEMDD